MRCSRSSTPSRSSSAVASPPPSDHPDYRYQHLVIAWAPGTAEVFAVRHTVAPNRQLVSAAATYTDGATQVALHCSRRLDDAPVSACGPFTFDDGVAVAHTALTASFSINSNGIADGGHFAGMRVGGWPVHEVHNDLVEPAAHPAWLPPPLELPSRAHIEATPETALGRVTWRSGTRWVETIEVDGRAIAPRARLAMKGLGSNHPRYDPLRWHDETMVAVERFAVATLDPNAVENLHQVSVVTDADGRDLLVDTLVYGDHPELGLAGFTDGAT